jgi:hypothetical protein
MGEMILLRSARKAHIDFQDVGFELRIDKKIDAEIHPDTKRKPLIPLEKGE